MFIEHIGPLIYRSLWSEMLDDRKFYFPITATEPAGAGERPGGIPAMQLRRWRAVGPAEAVTMDKDEPFVGEQSPRIALDGAAPRGIRQTGLSVEEGKDYVGHVWLKGTPGTTVQVALRWGAGADDGQTVSIAHLTNRYAEFPLRFRAKAVICHESAPVNWPICSRQVASRNPGFLSG